MDKKIGVAGVGAIGAAVCKALLDGIEGYELCGISDIDRDRAVRKINRPNYTPNFNSFEELAEISDIVVEALPAHSVPELADIVLSKGKTLILISSAALLMNPEIIEHANTSLGRIIVPSGALVGVDGVRALSFLGIRSARIRSTKQPKSFEGAPYIVENDVDLDAITEPTCLFEGTAREAARGFPANVNVAATLSLAGIGPEDTRVEIMADPGVVGNIHEIEVVGQYSTIQSKVLNTPDPANPKSSMLAAQSIIATLRLMSDKTAVI